MSLDMLDRYKIQALGGRGGRGDWGVGGWRARAGFVGPPTCVEDVGRGEWLRQAERPSNVQAAVDGWVGFMKV
jgi:hypothetical protein